MHAEVVIIGAGVIGLSVAKELAAKGHSVILLEKEERYGSGVSSRSTEVIHSGIYYKTGSLKAKLCVRGKRLLYEHCAKYKVKHKVIGKIILAGTKEEAARLGMVKEQALHNGVNDMIELDRGGIKRLEPNISGEAALLSPSSGIFDTHGFMKSIFKLGESQGMVFAALSPVTGAEPVKDGWRLMVGGNDPASVTCRIVINAAGLHSVDLSRAIFPGRNVPRLYPTKGSYARYSGVSPVKHIIYPALMPGLIEERVDMTPDLEGSLRFGPTVEMPEALEDFSVAPDLIERMAPTIKSRIPGFDITRIHPDCAGIRPRIFGSGEPAEDFRFEWAPVPGWLDMWGMESPGLTSSLAIAEHVYGLVSEKICFEKNREVANDAA